jgi:hypothetical protein
MTKNKPVPTKCNRRLIASWCSVKYYVENPNPPSTGRSLFMVGLMLLDLVIGLVWLFLNVFSLIWQQLF